MKTLLAVSAATLILIGFSTAADDSDAVAQAQVAAKSWLALTDSAKYGQSWDDAASIAKGAVTKADWEKAIKGVRSPLGAVKARKVKSATFTRTLPGARMASTSSFNSNHSSRIRPPRSRRSRRCMTRTASGGSPATSSNSRGKPNTVSGLLLGIKRGRFLVFSF